MKRLTNTLILVLLLIMAGLYSCEEDDPALNSATDILTFTLDEQTGTASIDATSHRVAIEVALGTDVSNLTPTFTLSTGATSIPASGTTGDYSNEVTITVTAEDGITTQIWTVAVSRLLSAETDILTFTLPEQTGNATIDNADHSVAVEVVNGTDMTSLTPTFTLSDGATSVPASGTAGDYSSAATITVTAEDGTTTQDWTIEVSEAPPGPSSAADILDFAVAEQSKLPTIDNINNTITVEVANGTDLTTLTPVLTISPGATSDPASGETGDYSSALVIEVTAEDEETVESWTVNVSERPAPGGPPSSETDILTFSVAGQTREAWIDDDGGVVQVFMPQGTDYTNITPTFTLSPGATSVPVSGTTLDYSNSSGQAPIFVTAEDGTTKQTWAIRFFDGIDTEILCGANNAGNCDDEDLLNECMDAYNECIARYGQDQVKACAIVATSICDQ